MLFRGLASYLIVFAINVINGEKIKKSIEWSLLRASVQC